MADPGEDGGKPLSEHDLIARYFAPLAAGFPGADGLKDDAAVIAPPPGADLVVTTDALIAGVHFFPDDAPADIAWKALAVNVSDLAAKGATPLAYSLALAMPGPPSPAFLGGFASGLGAAQQRFAIALSGGDTCAAPVLMIAITAFGIVPQGRIVRRGGAQPGDLLYVTGAIGDAALGLKLRRGDADAAGWPLSAAERDALIARYLRPEPRTLLAAALLAHASAAMDVSDGLAIDCQRLCAASGVAACIEAGAVPLSAAAASLAARPEALRLMLTGGDDYEILAAIPPGRAAAFEADSRAAGVAASRIGRVATAGGPGLTILGADGTPLDMGSPGFDHFSG
jgi:thiamine-monophosphate kinase